MPVPLFGAVGHRPHHQTNENHYVGRPFFEPDGGQYHTSHIFDVYELPVAVKLMQCLPQGGCIIVQQVMFENNIEFASDLWINGTRIQLDNTNTQIVLTVDGRYKLRLEGCLPDDVAVLQHRTGLYSSYRGV